MIPTSSDAGIWERIVIRRVGNSFIGEARYHAHFAVGQIRPTWVEAFNSAAEAMDREMAPIIRAKQARMMSTYEELL